MNFFDITQSGAEIPNDVPWFNILANKIHINDVVIENKIINTDYSNLKMNVSFLFQSNENLISIISNLQNEINILKNELLLLKTSYINLTVLT
jgi:hypothetical protein